MPKNFHRWEFRRSKCRRRCQRCSKIIPRGQEYFSSVTREEGQFIAKALCIACGAKQEEKRDEPENGTFDRYSMF